MQESVGVAFEQVFPVRIQSPVRVEQRPSLAARERAETGEIGVQVGVPGQQDLDIGRYDARGDGGGNTAHMRPDHGAQPVVCEQPLELGNIHDVKVHVDGHAAARCRIADRLHPGVVAGNVDRGSPGRPVAQTHLADAVKQPGRQRQSTYADFRSKSQSGFLQKRDDPARISRVDRRRVGGLQQQHRPGHAPSIPFRDLGFHQDMLLGKQYGVGL